MGKATVAVFVAAALVAGACSGSDSSAEPDVEPTPTTAIADAPTPEPAPTATVAPAATPAPVEPTATAEPDLSEDEAAVIAAWERYLDLSIQARGKSPSAEALDYEDYVIETSQEALLAEIAADEDAGRYITGTTLSEGESVEFRLDGAAIVSWCWTTSFVALSLTDDSIVNDEGEVTLIARARLNPVADGWRVAATEFEVSECAT